MLIRPEEVDDRTVLLPASHVALVEIGSGAVLVDEEAGRGLALNATASLVWKLIDSASPLGDLIDDVSDVFGVPRPEVADSVHGLVRVFGEWGLFRNVVRNLASVPVDVEYVDTDDCGEPLPARATHAAVDARYIAVPPNA